MPNDKQELSVNEILSAIRRNISSANDGMNAETEDEVKLNEQDIFDLTDEVTDNGKCFCVDSIPKALEEEIPSNISSSDISLNKCPGTSTDTLNKPFNKSNEIDCYKIDQGYNLDTLIREAIKNWMDANLPSIVNRIVEKEILSLAEKCKK